MLHAAFQACDDAADILVGHGTEHGKRIGGKPHVAQVLVQRGSRMRVVRHVEDHRWTSRHDLETPRQIDQDQAAAHFLRPNGQAQAQDFQRRQHRRSVEQLVGPAQAGITQRVAPHFTSAVVPLLLVAGIIEVTAEQPKIGADRLGVVDQRLRRHRIAAYGRFPGAEDAGLLETDGFARIAQVIRMIDVDAGHNGHVAVDHIDRIEPPAQAHFEDRHVELGLREQVADGQGGELEIGQRNLAARLLHHFKTGDQSLVRRHLAADACALIELEEMRFDVQTDTISRTQQDGFEHGAGRPLAVGAGNHDHRALELQIEAALDFGHALQAHIDRLEMAQLEQA